MDTLIDIQSRLKAPKKQYNEFGKYFFRDCEDILEAAKPLLLEHEALLYINDEIVNIGDRFYVKATVTFKPKTGDVVTISALAREEETKKGMDGAQVTGAASSYARKYALNGLFLIDDNKDEDNTNAGKDEKIDDEKVKEIEKLIKETNSDIVGFLDYFKISGVKNLLVSDYKRATSILMQKKNGGKK